MSIKLEPAFLAEHEEALLAAGYIKQTEVDGLVKGHTVEVISEVEHNSPARK